MASQFPLSLAKVHRYHIKPNGDAGLCRVTVGSCPYGDELEHYTNPQDARTAFAKVMSGKPWSTVSKESPSDWRLKSWPARKKEIEALLASLASIANVPKVEIRWDEELETRQQKINGDWVYGKANPVARYIRFSTKMQAMNEVEAKENAIHEFAHILVGTDHENSRGHSAGWRSKCEELAQHVPGMELTDFEDGTVVSLATEARIRVHDGMAAAPRWRGVCVNGHRDERSSKPSKSEQARLCHRCLLPPFRSRNEYVWEEL